MLNTFINNIVKNLNEGYGGIGLEPLIEEFVDSVVNITPEDREKRRLAITTYYKKVLDNSKSVVKAYNSTKRWIFLTFIQPYQKISENRNEEYKYSSVQILAPNNIAEEILKFSLGIPDDKIYIDEDTKGRELEVHITVKYGFTFPDKEQVEKELSKYTKKTIDVQLGELSLFEPKDKNYDVLKISVVSEDLKKLNKILSKLPNEDTHPKYSPHLTLAYIKKGTGKEYVGNKIFENLKFSVDFIEFSSYNGELSKIDLGGFNEKTNDNVYEKCFETDIQKENSKRQVEYNNICNSIFQEVLKDSEEKDDIDKRTISNVEAIVIKAPL